MILEAMAMGKAVVVTDTGGMPELVDYGKCGVCVPVMQVEPLAAALDRLANDAGRRTQLGEQARLRAVELHHPQAIARAWMALLTEVARRPGHARRGSAAGPRVESPVDLCCTG